MQRPLHAGGGAGGGGGPVRAADRVGVLVAVERGAEEEGVARRPGGGQKERLRGGEHPVLEA